MIGRRFLTLVKIFSFFLFFLFFSCVEIHFYGTREVAAASDDQFGVGRDWSPATLGPCGALIHFLLVRDNRKY
jgi:hypothetical protein